jgi:ketosteroid isomerase-like protein
MFVAAAFGTACQPAADRFDPQEIITDSNFALTLAPAQVEVSKGGDLAYSRGAYSVALTDPTTKRVITRKGKYVVVYWKQGDGRWKAIHDINNRNAP